MLTLNGIHVQPTTPRGASLKAIEAAIAYMRSTPARAINLQRLANAIDMDPFHLSHLFTRHTGLNLKHFHQLIRLKAAKNILAETSLSITHVALECGYDSLGTFASTFKRAVGLTPSEFRAYTNLLEASIGSVAPMDVGSPASINDKFGLATIHTQGTSCIGLVFVALCASTDGSVLNCTIAPFRDSGRLSLPNVSKAPDIALAAFYPSGMPLRSAALDGPALVGRSNNITSGGFDLTLRSPTLIDPPLISALPIMAIKRLADSSTARPVTNEATFGYLERTAHSF